MCRPTRLQFRGRLIRLGEMSEDDAQTLHRGVLAAARTQGQRAQHGKPHGVVRDDQPDAREGQAGRCGVAERLLVPLKPGNAGGGKAQVCEIVPLGRRPVALGVCHGAHGRR